MRTTQAQVVVALALALSLGSFARPALGQPVIRVEAQTRIELSTARVDGSTRVRAVLFDDQGALVAGAPLAIRIADATGQLLAARPRVLTGNDGAVEIALPAIEERISVDARFAGDDYRGQADAVELLDTRLALVELKITAPSPAIDLRERAVPVRVRARSSGGVAGLRVALNDEIGSALGTAITDGDGVAEIAVETSALGGPGPSKLIAHTDADDTRAAAIAELSIVRWLPSETTLALAQAGQQAIRARGEVRANGRGVAGALVGLFTPRGDHVATLRADDHGRYAGTLDQRKVGERGARAIELDARFESDAPWIGSSRSPLARLELATQSTYSWYWLALTPALVALLTWWLSRRRGAIELEPQPKERAEAGVALAQTKPRAVRLHHFTCVVLDARTGRSVGDATVELASDGAASTRVHSDPRGAIRSDELASGSYALLFEAPGYRALRATLDVPHRGEWSGAHVRLENLRDVAVRAWSPLAQQLAGKPEQANALTVREAILRAAQGSTAPPSFANEALQRTERAAYAQPAPSDEDVDHVERDASTLLRSNVAPRE